MPQRGDLNASFSANYAGGGSICNHVVEVTGQWSGGGLKLCKVPILRRLGQSFPQSGRWSVATRVHLEVEQWKSNGRKAAAR